MLLLGFHTVIGKHTHCDPHGPALEVIDQGISGEY